MLQNTSMNMAALLQSTADLNFCHKKTHRPKIRPFYPNRNRRQTWEKNSKLKVIYHLIIAIIYLQNKMGKTSVKDCSKIKGEFCSLYSVLCRIHSKFIPGLCTLPRVTIQQRKKYQDNTRISFDTSKYSFAEGVKEWSVHWAKSHNQLTIYCLH